MTEQTPKDRVLEERDELAARIVKLDRFVDSGAAQRLSPMSYDLIIAQGRIMHAYIACLHARLATWVEGQGQA